MLIRLVAKYGKKMVGRYGNVIASSALLLAVGFSIGSCRFILHQPEEPKELEKYINNIRVYRKSKLKYNPL